ncbi:MAG TPA: dienelactone hydrolase family protein [Vicinamibacteria bacterium]|nr:dienelactone hydrolase family protein [Vicinamibacteria bacterium]
MTLWSRLASGLAAAAAATTLLAAPGGRTENVVLITTDGLRWQEVFGGAEESLMTKEAGGVSDPAELRRAFWRERPAARREALLPFLSTVLARQGQLYGNATRGSVARVTNGHNFSYPGYNELLSGRADPRIDSNDKKANPNVTVLEWLNGRPPYRGKVAAFCSWGVFPWIINRERSGVLVNAGFEPVASAGDRPRLAMLNQLLADTTPFVDSVRHDSFTFAAALEHVRAARPRVLYVSFGETDDWAHLGRYDNYLYAAQRFDRFTRQLWDEMQGLGQYRGRTTFVITVDHGRGSGPTEWKNHGQKIPESEKIWIGVMGPDTPALGERAETATVTQSQIAATVAALLGEDFAPAMPGVAGPIEAALGPSPERKGTVMPPGSSGPDLDRARLLRMLGDTPAAPPPLAPERLEQVDLGDVVREKVTYAVEPGERVPAFVFVPKAGPGPHPAILCHHQHGGEFQVGKDGPAGLGSTPDQHYAIELARRGYVTIVADALCFGERQDPKFKLKNGEYERFEALHRITEGKTLQGKYVWDARRALDYLETRAEVDPSRIGMIGHSLGGQETLFTTAIDTRIKAAVSSCGFGSLRTLERDRILHNFALFVPELASHGDYGAVLALIAPRPFLVAARNDDPIFPMEGIEETVAGGRAAYAAAGVTDRLGTFYEPGPHQFSPAMREAAYAWLDRWLKTPAR